MWVGVGMGVGVCVVWVCVWVWCISQSQCTSLLPHVGRDSYNYYLATVMLCTRVLLLSDVIGLFNVCPSPRTSIM